MLLLTLNSDMISESDILWLMCDVRAYPTPTVSWIKSSSTESTVILNGTRTEITVELLIVDNYPVTRSTLIITNARVTDSGNYICEVTSTLDGYSTVSVNRDINVNGENNSKSSVAILINITS